MNKVKTVYEGKNLSFSYGKNKVLDDISFSIKEGKVTTLIGANGCGKSTLFQLLTRNLTPDAGTILLAQDTKLLLLDEPTTYLDIRYQVQILGLVRELNETYGMTIVMVLHDINQAFAYSDEILALKNGKIVAQGEPARLIDEELIQTVYDVKLPVYSIEEKKVVLAV